VNHSAYCVTVRALILVSLAALTTFSTHRCLAQEPTLGPTRLAQMLGMGIRDDQAATVAGQIRSLFGNGLATGANPKVEGLYVAWAIEAPGAANPPSVVALAGGGLWSLTPRPIPGNRDVFTLDSSATPEPPRIPLIHIGATDLYVYAGKVPDGFAIRWQYEVDGKKGREGQLEVYSVHPDSVANSNVPHGKLTQMEKFHSNVYKGTERDWWVYVPAQYTPDKPACVMVFQDGGGYKDYVPAVFDNLTVKGDTPITVGVFINPGTFTEGGRSNRSFEYDTLSDQYARFILEEILPEVEKTVKLRHDAQSRAAAGASSGGICAFTLAWERPSEFSKALSWVGSFTNIANGPDFKQGGHNYEAMVRKAPKRNIRVFLQDGANDLDNNNGNWPLANQTLAKSLAFAGYDYKFVFGNGFHSGSHGRAILPDSLRWLWRGYKAEP
jgi:enterochelin esterase-like enzyme